MNTLSGAMMDGLGEFYRRCDEDDGVRVRVVVVTGAGDAFCAGADMSGGGETFDADGKELDFSSCPLNCQAWDVRKPVIAACNGHAIGVGLGSVAHPSLELMTAGLQPEANRLSRWSQVERVSPVIYSPSPDLLTVLLGEIQAMQA